MAETQLARPATTEEEIALRSALVGLRAARQLIDPDPDAWRASVRLTKAEVLEVIDGSIDNVEFVLAKR